MRSLCCAAVTRGDLKWCGEEVAGVCEAEEVGGGWTYFGVDGAGKGRGERVEEEGQVECTAVTAGEQAEEDMRGARGRGSCDGRARW